MKREKTVDAYTCDCCGADVVEQGRRRFRIDFMTDDVYEVTDHA